jgi:hypothetical protein
MESILTSIKKLLGIEDEYTHFDSDIVMHINTVFMTLTQLGVGPSGGFFITDKNATWGQFVPDEVTYQAVKTYMYLRVRLLFDPSSLGSATLAAFERQIKEFEWRLNVAAESTVKDTGDSTPTYGTVEGAITNCEKLNVRARPDENASIVCMLYVSDKFTVDLDKSKDGWYCVYTTGGYWGYCQKVYVKLLA